MAAWQTNSNEMPATISQNVKNFLENHAVRRQIMHATTCEKLQFAFVNIRKIFRFKNVEIQIFNKDFKEFLYIKECNGISNLLLQLFFYSSPFLTLELETKTIS